MVAAVATLEPEVAANIAQAAMLECISPPGSHGIHSTSALYIRSAIPERSRISPSSTKNGMATSRKLLDVPQAISPMANESGSGEYTPESVRPRMPRPAATGTASASRPTRMTMVSPSMSACRAFLPLLEIADLVLHLLLGRTRADGSCHAVQLAAPAQDQRVDQQQDADRDETQQTGDPEQLRDHDRRLQRRLAVRARGPRLRDDAEAVPGHQPEKSDEQHQRHHVEKKPQLLREQPIERIDADMGAIDQRRTEPPRGADGERVARELVGAADRAGQKFSHQDVDADQDCGQQHQRAAEPEPPKREAAHLPHQLFHAPKTPQGYRIRLEASRKRLPLPACGDRVGVRGIS